jgi:hypothetical protein
MTVREAAAAAGVSLAAVQYDRTRPSPGGAAFDEDVLSAMREGMPRRAARVRKGTASRHLRRWAPSAASSGKETMVVAGMRVTSVRRALDLHEVASLTGLPVRRVRGLMRRHTEDPDDPLGLASLPGTRRRLVPVEELTGHPLVVARPLALVLLARLIEDRLQLPRLAAETTVPEDHIVVLRGLL